MNTMEITKFVGAGCGALLVFLLMKTGAEAIYHSGGHGDDHHNAYEIEVASAETEPVEEEPEIDFAEVYAAADAAAGEGLFRACAACHKLEPGANGAGPYLHGIVDRDIAAADGFNYSDVLNEMEGDWTPENISAFILNPKAFASGTKMAYRGMRDVQDRADLIAYLATFQ